MACWNRSAHLGIALPWLLLVGCVASSAGDRLLESERPHEAAVAYSRLASNRAGLHQKLGLAFLRAGLPAAAEREWLRAKELEPSDPAVEFWLGQVALRDRDTTKARVHWEEFLRLRPSAWAEVDPAGSAIEGDRFAAVWEAIRPAEEEAVIHPERARGRRLLESMSARLDGPGLVTAGEDEWDLRVTDAEAWTLGTAGLPEFPPPPGVHR